MQRIRRATIRDVALRAGVGTTTVSRVLNGGKLVAPRVRLNIEAVIRELGYQPSHAARSLAQSKSHSIGMIVPRLTDPFFAAIVHAAQQTCRVQGYTLLISTTSDVEAQALEELETFERQRVDGLLVIPPADQSVLFRQQCEVLAGRVVSVDLPVTGEGFSSVLTDNAAAMERATAHLIAHGRRRILFLGSSPELYTMRERRRGYVAALHHAGLKLVHCDPVDSFESVDRAIAHTSTGKNAIDGIVTANGLLGICAFQSLQKRNIPVPSRIALFTFDDFSLADSLRPAVSCVAQPVNELGKFATELLLNQLDSPEPEIRNVQIASTLMLRESCGCP